MKPMDLMEAIGNLPADCIGSESAEPLNPAAETKKPRKSIAVRPGVTAALIACLLLAVGFGAVLLNRGRGEIPVQNRENESVTVLTETEPETTAPPQEQEASCTDGTAALTELTSCAEVNYPASLSGTASAAVSAQTTTGDLVFRTIVKKTETTADPNSETANTKLSTKKICVTGKHTDIPVKVIDPAPEEVSMTIDYTGRAVTWHDFLSGNAYPAEELNESIKVSAFPDAVFSWTGSTVTVTENGYQAVFGEVWNAFFDDLNGDGCPELCMTVSFGSGIIDERIYVYDHRAQKTYTLCERGYFDYVLHEENGVLSVNRSPYPDFDPQQSGRKGTLELDDGRLYFRCNYDTRDRIYRTNSFEEVQREGDRLFRTFERRLAELRGEIAESAPRLSASEINQLKQSGMSFADIERTLREKYIPDVFGGSGHTVTEYWFDESGMAKAVLYSEDEQLNIVLDNQEG